MINPEEIVRLVDTMQTNVPFVSVEQLIEDIEAGCFALKEAPIVFKSGNSGFRTCIMHGAPVGSACKYSFELQELGRQLFIFKGGRQVSGAQRTLGQETVDRLVELIRRRNPTIESFKAQ